MQRLAYYIINGITFYRIIASAFLLYLIISHQPGIFKWFLAASFFTDSIDGILARRFHVDSKRGAILDSIGDDLTVLMGIIGLIVFKGDFISDHLLSLVALFILFIIEVLSALIRFGLLTSFHTYLAKIAAIVQGTFLILAFFMKEPSTALFYIAVGITALDLLEEIWITWLLPEKKQNVKGVYWVLRDSKVPLLIILAGLCG